MPSYRLLRRSLYDPATPQTCRSCGETLGLAHFAVRDRANPLTGLVIHSACARCRKNASVKTRTKPKPELLTSVNKPAPRVGRRSDPLIVDALKNDLCAAHAALTRHTTILRQAAEQPNSANIVARDPTHEDHLLAIAQRSSRRGLAFMQTLDQVRAAHDETEHRIQILENALSNIRPHTSPYCVDLHPYHPLSHYFSHTPYRVHPLSLNHTQQQAQAAYATTHHVSPDITPAPGCYKTPLYTVGHYAEINTQHITSTGACLLSLKHGTPVVLQTEKEKLLQNEKEKGAPLTPRLPVAHHTTLNLAWLPYENLLRSRLMALAREEQRLGDAGAYNDETHARLTHTAPLYAQIKSQLRLAKTAGVLPWGHLLAPALFPAGLLHEALLTDEGHLSGRMALAFAVAPWLAALRGRARVAQYNGVEDVEVFKLLDSVDLRTSALWLLVPPTTLIRTLDNELLTGVNNSPVDELSLRRIERLMGGKKNASVKTLPPPPTTPYTVSDFDPRHNPLLYTTPRRLIDAYTQAVLTPTELQNEVNAIAARTNPRGQFNYGE